MWRKIFPGDAEWSRRDVRDSIARWHDKTGKGYDTCVGYVEMHYPAARDLEEFTYFSQLNQRDALRFGIEHYRRSVGCRGALIWQLNDCWSVQSWAVLDSDGAYEAAAFELRRLYAAAHHSLEWEVGASTAKLWTMLDNAHAPVRGEAVLEARRLSDGAVLERWSQCVELRPAERVVSIDAALAQFSPRDTLPAATFLGRPYVPAALGTKRGQAVGARATPLALRRGRARRDGSTRRRSLRVGRRPRAARQLHHLARSGAGEASRARPWRAPLRAQPRRPASNSLTSA